MCGHVRARPVSMRCLRDPHADALHIRCNVNLVVILIVRVQLEPLDAIEAPRPPCAYAGLRRVTPRVVYPDAAQAGQPEDQRNSQARRSGRDHPIAPSDRAYRRTVMSQILYITVGY